MKRTDASGATVDNLFTEGDPLGGVPATMLDASWCNAMQEELANTVEGAGLTLNPAADTQLLQAIPLLAGGLSSMKSLTANGYQKFPGGLILQWGSQAAGSQSGGIGAIAFPLAFPAAVLGAWGAVKDLSATNNQDVGVGQITLNGMNIYISGATNKNIYWFALGH